MNQYLLLLFSILVFYSTQSSAQKKETTMASITGSIMVSTEGESIFYNMGGPSFKISYDKWFAALNMFPSLRFFEVNGSWNVNPLLGTGLTIGYKRYMIGFPCYYLAAKNIWIFTVGAGIRLGK